VCFYQSADRHFVPTLAMPTAGDPPPVVPTLIIPTDIADDPPPLVPTLVIPTAGDPPPLVPTLVIPTAGDPPPFVPTLVIPTAGEPPPLVPTLVIPTAGDPPPVVPTLAIPTAEPGDPPPIVPTATAAIVTRRRLQLATPGRRKIAKKGYADPSTWKRNLKINRSMLGEKRILKPINCRCCDKKFTQQQRENILKSFWQISWQRKKDYIVSHVKRTTKKRLTAGTGSRRAFTLTYHLPNEVEIQKVCKKFFMNTLDIGESVIARVVNQAADLQLVVSPKDGRLGRIPHNKTKDTERQGVQEFLSKLPTMPSHYCRHDTKLTYLEPGWTVRKLHDLYVKECRTNGKPFVSQRIFTRIFSELNLAVFSPRKDQCDRCLGHANGLVNDDEYNQHVIDKDLARASKAADKLLGQESPTTIVLTMDLQQVLLCPRSKSSATYYKRKLAVHCS